MCACVCVCLSSQHTKALRVAERSGRMCFIHFCPDLHVCQSEPERQREDFLIQLRRRRGWVNVFLRHARVKFLTQSPPNSFNMWIKVGISRRVKKVREPEYTRKKSGEKKLQILEFAKRKKQHTHKQTLSSQTRKGE